MEKRTSYNKKLLEKQPENGTGTQEQKQKTTWVSKSTYIDIETGEIIDKKIAETDYIIIKTNKNVNFNKEKNTGTINYTRECKRKWKQQQLNFHNQ